MAFCPQPPTGLPLAGILHAGPESREGLLQSVLSARPDRDAARQAFQALGEHCLVWSPAKPLALPFLFLGRLDNRAELRAVLGEAPAADDAALAARAWARWGEEAAARLIGAFVFVAWDAPRQDLVLAADQMGSETLFTATGRDFFAFAGHPLSLRGLPGVPAELDIRHFCHWMFTFRTLVDRSLFTGIGRLPPGHVMRVGRHGAVSRPYWRPGTAAPIRFRHDEDYVLAARDMLERVVAPHLPAQDGAIAAELSGGLDSSAVVATAARLRPDCRLATFTTVAEPGVPLPPARVRRADGDWQGACGVAALYPNISLNRIEAPGLQPMEADPAPVFAALAYPLLFRENHAWHESKRAAIRQQGYQVVLTGDGGNFTLSQTGSGLLADLALSGRWVALLREAQAVQRATGRTLRTVLESYALRPILPAGPRQLIRRLRGKPEPAWLPWTSLRPEVVGRFHLAEELARGGKLRPFESVGSARGQLLDMIDRYIGKNHWRSWLARSQGLEIRVPLMDVRMVDFTLALPQEQFCRQGVDRWLARRVLADRLPHAVAWDPRRHRQCAEWAFRAHRSRPYWMAALQRLEAVPLAGDLLDLPRLKALAASWPDPSAVTDGVSLHQEVLLPGIAGGCFLEWAGRLVEGGSQPDAG